ncbi:fructose-bisphosphatase class II, partial [Klebsiella pneumoniae]|uniref:fructose-bisphosphatase class II n=1 Tax=Klebsiella pneumoniae TaxID=573 RepID=UPI003A8B9C0B
MPVAENIRRSAKATTETPADVTVVMLDRPRHDHLAEAIDLRDRPRSGDGLAHAARHHENEREVTGARDHVGQPFRGRLVQPLGVVQEDQQRLLLRQVRGEPVEAVDAGERV